MNPHEGHSKGHGPHVIFALHGHGEAPGTTLAEMQKPRLAAEHDAAS